MPRANSLEKTLMLGKIEGRRRRGQQRMKWLDGITDFVVEQRIGGRKKLQLTFYQLFLNTLFPRELTKFLFEYYVKDKEPFYELGFTIRNVKVSLKGQVTYFLRFRAFYYHTIYLKKIKSYITLL